MPIPRERQWRRGESYQRHFKDRHQCENVVADEHSRSDPDQQAVEREYGEIPTARAGQQRAVAEQPSVMEANGDPGTGGYFQANENGGNPWESVPQQSHYVS